MPARFKSWAVGLGALITPLFLHTSARADCIDLQACLRPLCAAPNHLVYGSVLGFRQEEHRAKVHIHSVVALESSDTPLPEVGTEFEIQALSLQLNDRLVFVVPPDYQEGASLGDWPSLTYYRFIGQSRVNCSLGSPVLGYPEAWLLELMESESCREDLDEKVAPGICNDTGDCQSGQSPMGFMGLSLSLGLWWYTRRHIRLRTR